jgi:hypothetical protein
MLCHHPQDYENIYSVVMTDFIFLTFGKALLPPPANPERPFQEGHVLHSWRRQQAPHQPYPHPTAQHILTLVKLCRPPAGSVKRSREASQQQLRRLRAQGRRNALAACGRSTLAAWLARVECRFRWERMRGGLQHGRPRVQCELWLRRPRGEGWALGSGGRRSG